MLTQNQIGRALMKDATIPLTLPMGRICDMCRWLQGKLASAETQSDSEAYAIEILWHRRSYHISSDGDIN